MFFDSRAPSRIGKPQGIAQATGTGDLLTQAEVASLIRVSRAWLHRHVKDESFPSPIRISNRALRWRKAEIEAWLEERKS